MKTPPGSLGASKFQEFFVEFKYVEFICDHPPKKESEAKNYQNFERLHDNGTVKSFFTCLLLLALFRVDGRIQTQ